MHLQLVTSLQQSQSPEDQGTGECEFKLEEAGFVCFVRGCSKSKECGGWGGADGAWGHNSSMTELIVEEQYQCVYVRESAFWSPGLFVQTNVSLRAWAVWLGQPSIGLGGFSFWANVVCFSGALTIGKMFGKILLLHSGQIGGTVFMNVMCHSMGKKLSS